MKIRNVLVIAGVAASTLVVADRSIAAVYTYNLTFDPSTFPCATGNGYRECYALDSIVPATDNPGDQYIINVSFTGPISVGASKTISQVYAGFYDTTALLDGTDYPNAEEYHTSSVTGYVGPAGLDLGGWLSANAGYYGGAIIFGPNAGFSVTGFSTDITVETKDHYPLVGLVVASEIGVPEPATWTMLLAGFAGLGLAMRSRRRAAVTTP